LELLVKNFDCVFHIHASTLPQPLGHPLSNQKIFEDSKALQNLATGHCSLFGIAPHPRDGKT
jgi:hypothetical protein